MFFVDGFGVILCCLRCLVWSVVSYLLLEVVLVVVFGFELMLVFVFVCFECGDDIVGVCCVMNVMWCVWVVMWVCVVLLFVCLRVRRARRRRGK